MPSLSSTVRRHSMAFRCPVFRRSSFAFQLMTAHRYSIALLLNVFPCHR
nr:MAG TPA: hypothetical protein [Caudoviricetes sp.]